LPDIVQEIETILRFLMSPCLTPYVPKILMMSSAVYVFCCG
jgi:hypothetical protein